MTSARAIARRFFIRARNQKRNAEAVIAGLDAAGVWPDRIVTEVVPAAQFWEAEPEHQDFLER